MAKTKKTLEESHPEIAAQFLSSESGLTPRDVSAGSNKRFTWKCPKGEDHIWSAVIADRTKGRGCPVCTGRKVVKSNCLNTTHPEIAKQFLSSEDGATPNTVTHGSKKKFKWKCEEGDDHIWRATVNNRTNGSTCPICSGDKAVASNCLATTHPDLAKQFLSSKNGRTPRTVTAGSNFKFRWKCQRGDDHIWEAQVYLRANYGQSCPFCIGNRTAKSNKLSTTHPEIAKQFLSSEDGATPNTVTHGSKKKFKWKCEKGDDHIWTATVNSRTSQNSGCPICRGLKTTISNCLNTTHPELAKQFVSSEDGENPNTVTHGSGKKFKWRCIENPNHTWDATVTSRINKKSGCPICNSGWTVENIKRFIRSLLTADLTTTLNSAELFLLAQQNGLINTESRRSEFIKALTAGKLPKEELEKFANGKENSIDALLGEESAEDYVADGTAEAMEEELATNVDESNEQTSEDEILPSLKAKDVLDSAASKLWVSMDDEAVEFLIASKVAALWKLAYDPKNLEEVKRDTSSLQTAEYSEQIRQRFLKELDAAETFKLPPGYSFKIDSKPIKPNLMQKHVASQMVARKRLGNWSGTGAGKTLSAAIASRALDANLTVILCPNPVISGWKDTLNNAFPGSQVLTKTLKPKWKKTKSPKYLVLNFETLQQPNAEADLADFLTEYLIDFIVIDEIHYVKQRDEKVLSKRRKLIEGLCSNATKKNTNCAILGMSATPVINNLKEGVSMIELVTGYKHDDLKTNATVPNCLKIYQKLVLNGVRWMPPYPKFGESNPDVDVSDRIDEIKEAMDSKSLVPLERVLVNAKMDEILKHVKDGTIIYSEFVENIVDELTHSLETKGWRVGKYTGKEKSGLELFKNNKVNVLVASSAVATGVDGLQHRADRLIIACAPWTAANYEQLIGRLVRQGQKKPVEVIFPIATARYLENGEQKEWSWCQSRLNRILYKKDIADSAVDGVVPTGSLRTPEQAKRDAKGWLDRIDSEQFLTCERELVDIQLSTKRKDVEARLAKYGDFSKMNNQWNATGSEKLHERLVSNREEWQNYHSLYREARKTWAIIPFESIGDEISKMPKRKIIADFGCGEDLLGARLREAGYQVHSFDHIPATDDVIALDIGDGVSLEDQAIDVAVFCLSLMGANCADYLREAARVLAYDGRLYLCEPTSRLPEEEVIEQRLLELGFETTKISNMDKFTFVHAVRTDSIPKQNVSFI